MEEAKEENKPFSSEQILESDEDSQKQWAAQVDRLVPNATGKFKGRGKRKQTVEEEDENERERRIESTPLGLDPLSEGGIVEEEDDEEDDQMKNEDQGSPKERKNQNPLDGEYIQKQQYMASEAYKPTSFGDFRSYMKNKRLKLKVQELSMSENEKLAQKHAKDQEYPNGNDNEKIYPILFKGTNIYINGHTNPPYGELRRLIHLYGGELLPYLDQKGSVTHIIASNLTSKKRIEFKDYKIVLPDWITESIKQNKRLDWRDFRCTEDSTGAMNQGALGQQSIVGRKEFKIEAEQAKKRLEEARLSAARSDWRSLGKATTDSGIVNPLRAYAHSGSGAGVENGVGPWGKSSRQKTLGTWARHDDTAGKKEDDSTVEEVEPQIKSTEASSSVVKKPSNAQQAKRVTFQDDPETHIPPSIQMTAEDEFWDEVLESEDVLSGHAKKDFKVQDDTEMTLVEKEIDIANPVTPTKHDKPDEKIFPDIGTDPSTEAAAIAAGLRKSNHPYASRPSNVKAAQLMASPSWRERNTATSDSFLQGYFTKSRLHHLSVWKSEMREMVSQALREARREEGGIDLPIGLKRVIFHIDFDAFFVSVGLRNRSDLQDQAVVVCHADSETQNDSSTSEIASCNYIARRHGIRNGMSLGQARRYCPSVTTIPYDFTAYNDIAIKFYTLLLTHSDAIEAVSIDEALIDVSFLLDEMRNQVQSMEPARQSLMTSYKDHESSQGDRWTEEKQLAESIRDEIRKQTGCEASIGIGSNVLLARLATRKAKPGGSFHLKDDEISNFIDDLEIDDLHGVGWSIRNRCKDEFGTSNVGELKEKATKSKFVTMFGDKHGVTIWEKLHGKEREKLESIKPRQSCGASVNYAIRFTTEEEVKDFIFRLSEEVSNRLKQIQMVGRLCCVSLMIRSKDAPIEAPKFLGHGICDSFNRSTPLPKLTDEKEVIFNTAWKLINALKVQPDQFRGIGVSLQKLEQKDSIHLPGKRDAGQSMLSFAKREKHQPEIKDDVRQEGDSIKETEANLKEEDKDANVFLDKARPATQFVIPPFSQLDQDVVAALPDSIKNQILKNGSTTSNAILHPKLPITETSRESSPSNTSTPRKHRIIDPFERMRAASMTPTKKKIVKQSNMSAAISSAPSTPSGSQKRNERNSVKRQSWEPTWSQIDPKVISELPEELREEIIRQLQPAGGGGGSSSSSSKIISAIAQEMERSVSDDALKRRSHSESPRKRQAYLDFLGSRPKPLNSTNAQAVIDGNASLPPLIPPVNRAIKLGQSSRSSPGLGGGNINGNVAQQQNPIIKIDPKKVTKEELISLEIDSEVFFALPLNVQQETLDQQSNLIASKKARFKLGKHFEDLTFAQQRLIQRRLALPEEEEGGGDSKKEFKQFHAIKSFSPEQQPSIKGISDLTDICDLITAWIEKFAHSGPRDRDKDRFMKFLIECIEGVSGGKYPPPIDGLEKTYGVLQCWTRMLKRIEWGEAEEIVKQSWWNSLRDVHEKVNQSIQNRFGGSLSLKD